MEKLRFGVIGIKGIGTLHIEAINQVEEAELVGFAEIDEQVVRDGVAKYGVEGYSYYESLLKRTDVDAVAICTPHFLHAPMAIKAAECQKHILMEKPMAISVGEADEMIQAAKDNGVKLGVVYQYRTTPLSLEIKRLLAEGELGEIYRVVLEASSIRTQSYYNSGDWRGTWWGEGGGVLINQSIHDFDLMVWFLGLPDRVYAVADTFMHDIEVEDRVDAILEYANGARGYFHVNTIDAPSISRIEICGSKGKLVQEDELRVAKLEQPLDEFIASSEEVWGSPRWEWETVQLPEVESGHKVVIKEFAQAVIEDRMPPVSGEEGLKSLEIVNAITLSAKRGKVVELPVNREEYAELLRELRGK